eukprot:1863041-Ditylum_brightwellii.AAC.1
MATCDTDPALSEAITTYLHRKGNIHFSLLPGPPSLQPLGLLTDQNEIGFLNFLVGMFSSSLPQHQEEYYLAI